MTQCSDAPTVSVTHAQAAELSRLVDLEARWENLRKFPPRHADGARATKELVARQKCYDDFRARLAAYNARYAPAHVPELLLNTPARLGGWCRKMRDLLRQVGHDPEAHCPTDLLEKAHRLAGRIAVRVNATWAPGAAPATIEGVIREFEALLRWCDDLVGVAPPEAQPASPPAALPG